jgi:hypothetical protein
MSGTENTGVVTTVASFVGAPGSTRTASVGAGYPIALDDDTTR